MNKCTWKIHEWANENGYLTKNTGQHETWKETTDNYKYVTHIKILTEKHAKHTWNLIINK